MAWTRIAYAAAAGNGNLARAPSGAGTIRVVYTTAQNGYVVIVVWNVVAH